MFVTFKRASVVASETNIDKATYGFHSIWVFNKYSLALKVAVMVVANFFFALEQINYAS